MIMRFSIFVLMLILISGCDSDEKDYWKKSYYEVSNDYRELKENISEERARFRREIMQNRSAYENQLVGNEALSGQLVIYREVVDLIHNGEIDAAIVKARTINYENITELDMRIVDYINKSELENDLDKAFKKIEYKYNSGIFRNAMNYVAGVFPVLIIIVNMIAVSYIIVQSIKSFGDDQISKHSAIILSSVLIMASLASNQYTDTSLAYYIFSSVTNIDVKEVAKISDSGFVGIIGNIIGTIVPLIAGVFTGYYAKKFRMNSDSYNSSMALVALMSLVLVAIFNAAIDFNKFDGGDPIFKQNLMFVLGGVVMFAFYNVNGKKKNDDTNSR